MTFANNLDPDEAPQNVGLHLRSKLFDIQIIYRHKKLVGNKDFLRILKKKIFKKNYPACKGLKTNLRLTFMSSLSALYPGGERPGSLDPLLLELLHPMMALSQRHARPITKFYIISNLRNSLVSNNVALYSWL